MLRKIELISTITILILLSKIAFAKDGNEIVSQRLEKFVKDTNAVSVNVALVRNGKITFRGAHGKANIKKGIDATTKHQYMIGSVSKLFTGTAIMQLVEKGEIDLNADINKYLPFRVRNPKHPEIPITIEMLMRHESSIANMGDLQSKLYVDGDSKMSLKELCNKVFDSNGEFYKKSNFEDYRPGKKWEYRNWNYVLLGYIVERVTGLQYYEYSNKNIIGPLKMHSAKWFLKDLKLDDLAVHYKPLESGKHSPIEYYGWPGYPDGQLRANVEEMANFLIMILNNGEFGGKRILTKNSISRMLTTKKYDSLTGSRFKGMGLTWFVNAGHDGVYSHGGSPAGTRIDVLIDRESNSGFVFFVTGIDEHKDWNKLKGLILDLHELSRTPAWSVRLRQHLHR